MTMPVETFAAMGLELKAKSPFPRTFSDRAGQRLLRLHADARAAQARRIRELGRNQPTRNQGRAEDNGGVVANGGANEAAIAMNLAQATVELRVGRGTAPIPSRPAMRLAPPDRLLQEDAEVAEENIGRKTSARSASSCKILVH